MPRSKAFSSKQKKQQLQDRRRRKADGPNYAKDKYLVGDDEDEDVKDKEDENPVETLGNKTNQCVNPGVDRLNHQPLYNELGKYDPNRYRMHFFKEKKEDIQKRKKKAYQPYYSLSEESLELAADLQLDHGIDVPQRPDWDYSLTKQQLEANEERYFKDYIDKIFSQHEADSLSFFELNLETWRQLWRVLEMSDMFLLITDIRHPTLHFPPALYTYITEVLKKDIVLVLNKVDLAPPSLVVAWKHFFKSRFPLLNIICFTSFPKTRDELQAVSDGIGKVIFKKRKRGTYKAMGPKELLAVCTDLVQNNVDLSSWSKKIDIDQGAGCLYDSDEEEDDDDDDGGGGSKKPDRESREPSDFHNEERFKDGVLTIGCIGYPNAGKSSVLNGLMGKKVVSVSKTPGHTKYFQTIFLTPSVRLCDSPGVIFPSKSNRTLQVLSGAYPVSQVREPYSVVEFLAQRLDLPQLLHHIKHPEESDLQEDATKPSWTSMDICEAWGGKRGFMIARTGRPDVYRSAIDILHMAVNGRLCLCFYPHGYIKSKEKWNTHQDTIDLIELQHKYSQNTQASGDVDSGDSAGSQSEEEGQSGDEESREPISFTSKNPFDLLGED